jgi:hypothetical protein
MIKCSYCGKDVERNWHGGIIINQDGDHVCDENCKSKYERERDAFFNNIGNDDWYNQWMDGKDSIEIKNS